MWAAAAGLSVGLSVLGLGQQAAAPALPAARAFVRGGEAGVDAIKTPWADRTVQWTVKSAAGTVASGQARIDKDGTAALRFLVPEVRVAARMALALAPVGPPQAQRRTMELVVLPADAFADVRKTLGEFEIGLLPGGPLGTALKRSRLPHSELDKLLVRGRFRGQIVVLSGLLDGGLKATDEYVRSLPPGSCLIVANDRLEKTSGFSLVGSLAAGEPPKQSQAIVPAESLVWTGLAPDWLGQSCGRHSLARPSGLVLLHVLAGHAAPDGTIYPLAMELRDVGGRWWLVWNPSEPIGREDPRWDLLLRNSLLWARRHILAGLAPGQT